MDSSNYMTCSLKVNTHSKGWHKSLVKVFQNIQGISYSIDAQQGIVQITGNIDPNKILMLLAKAGKHAELCRIDSGYLKRDLPKVSANDHGYNPPYGTLVGSNGHDYGYDPPYGILDYNRDNPQYGTLDYYRDKPQQRNSYSHRQHHPHHQHYEPYDPPYGTLDYNRDNPRFGTLDYYRDNPQQRNGYSHQQHHPHHQHYEPPAWYLPLPAPPPRSLNMVESPCKIM